MQIKSVTFVKSAVKRKDYPEAGLPEIAVAGRSNAGKSTLINVLLGRRQLARTSSKPGHTRLLNFYLVNQEFYLVDLPGYGYAKVSKSMRDSWRPMVEDYLSAGRTGGLILIMDIRRNPQEEEENFIAWLEEYQISTLLVLSKADKIGRNKRRERLSHAARELHLDISQVAAFSALSKEGRADIWRWIASCVRGDVY